MLYPGKTYQFLSTKRNRFRVLIASIIIVNVFGILAIWTKIVGLSKWHTVFDANDKFIHNTGNIIIKFANVDDRLVYTVEKFDRIIHQIQLSEHYNGSVISVEIENRSVFKINGVERHIEFEIQEDNENFTLIKVSTKLNANQNDNHCVNLKTGRMHWYGGSIGKNQYWPIEKHEYDDADESKNKGEISFEENYWLNSRGGFIYVDDKVPLFDEQNIHGNNLCLKVENQPPYNTHREFTDFIYYLGAERDAREAQRMAVKRFLKKPTGLVDRRMVEYPVWSTWRRFYHSFNESAIKLYASEIEKYGFKHSQIAIDDGWEPCYGSLKFNPETFPNIRRLTKHLQKRGFRVTLWAHPFINEDCEPWYSEALQRGYLVKSYNGSEKLKWWNTKKSYETAAHIDFTNPAAAEWYMDRLKKLQKESGIDSYKFDGGEAFSLPKDPKLHADVAEHPSALVKAYVRTVSQFGPMVEVRTGSGTQDLRTFVRIRDRKAIWHHIDGGFSTLVPSLLNTNINGYVFCIPDMIGGQTSDRPTEELFIRWFQASIFMPVIQYSYPPWDYSAYALKLCKEFTNLHAQYTDVIMDAFETAVKRGEPVNPPIWWLDPNDDVALSITDEFLLSDRILSAPILDQNQTSRDVYLPKSKWYDPNLNKIYFGPRWLTNYPAPIDILPYFIRMKSET